METSMHYLTHMNISLLFIFRNTSQKFAHEHKTMELLEEMPNSVLWLAVTDLVIIYDNIYNCSNIY